MSIPGMLRIPGMMAVAICVCFEKHSHYFLNKLVVY